MISRSLVGIPVKLLRILSILGVAGVLIGSLSTRFLRDSAYNNHFAHQAQAFLRGQIAIEDELHDVAVYNEQRYVVFPPFPAFLLMPFVALFGIENTKPMWVALLLSVGNIFLLRCILRRIELPEKYNTWTLLAFFFGTGYWFVLRESTCCWQFAHVVTITCLFLATNEAFGKRRGLLVGIFFGMAVLSRLTTIFFFIFFGTLIWRQNEVSRKGRILNLGSFLLALGFFLGAYMLFNYMRFDNAFQTGYAYIPLSGFLKERVDSYGIFNIAYIPFNFIYMFLQGFLIEFSPPTYLWVYRSNIFGTSLTFASPFVFFALWARWGNNKLRATWISIGLVMLTGLLYYNNGWAQLNTQRFTLDFLPILIILVAIGMQHIREVIWKAAIIYSVALNSIALFIVPMMNRLSMLTR